MREKLKFHQIHPAKLSTDILSSLIAVFFYWQHLLVWGLLTTFVPPLIATVLTIRYVDLSHLKSSRFGKYWQRHMTTSLSIVRISGNFVMLSGAWYHNYVIIFLGVAAVLACWCWGLALDALAS